MMVLVVVARVSSVCVPFWDMRIIAKLVIALWWTITMVAPT